MTNDLAYKSSYGSIELDHKMPILDDPHYRCFRATSAYELKQKVFASRSAAEYWLTAVAARVISREARLGSYVEEV